MSKKYEGMIRELEIELSFCKNLLENKIPKLLGDKIKLFVHNNVHKGFHKPFEIKEFDVNNYSVCLIFKGIEEEILDIDEDYDKKLEEIGNPYGLRISIHPGYYGK
jgi:hypothetical protein